MNSSCLKTLVTWLNNVRQRPPSAQYLVRFLQDRTAYWQERSLAALKAFAPATFRSSRASEGCNVHTARRPPRVWRGGRVRGQAVRCVAQRAHAAPAIVFQALV